MDMKHTHEPIPKLGNTDPQIFRCGWCGSPTHENGDTLIFESDEFNKSVEIINEHGDKFTKLVNGNCCPNGHE